MADLLRLLGPLTEAEIAERSTATDVGGWLTVSTPPNASAGVLCGPVVVVGIEDIGRLRDAVGVAVPVGVPTSFTETVPDPLGELLGRFARTRGPFTTAEAAARFGLGLRVAADVLGRMALDGKLVRGEFVAGPDADQWCDAEVLRILRRRSLAALRAQVEPVSTAAYARFLPAWQQVGRSAISGVDGLAGVIDQLAGVPIPASAVEPLVFAPRVRDYQPAMLDELLASGEVTWSGAGSISGSDGWIAFHHADTAGLTLAAPAEIEFTDAHRAIFDVLGSPGESRGAFFFRQLVQGSEDETQNRAVGTDLGGLGHRRHVRPGTGDAVRRTQAGHPPARRARSPAAPGPPAQPLLGGTRAEPTGRPDRRRALVGIAGG